MSSEEKKKFLEKAAIKVKDLEHKRKIAFNIDKYEGAVVKGKQQFDNLELARKKAKNTKWKAIEYLDKNLELFEKNFMERGGKVVWAENVQEALNAVLEICKKHKTKTVVKSKSMVTEELHLNSFLADNNIESIETDLGEYIQQLDGEPPYHIVTPAMHKSKEDIAALFHDKLGVPPNLSPKELTLIAREKLRQKYIEAEVGITGGNFLIADIGAVCVTENEGNARLTTAFPPVHIAIVGIEKLLPSINDLALFWPLLSTYGTGQKLTVYNSIFTGPKQSKETDGPKEMYVILLDNGRTNLLRKEVRESMYCIRCGACLNVCPVYKNIGGHSYDTTYSGPIGSVITPHLKGMYEFNHLSHASSLCGACTATCPVNINIHGMLLKNRHIAVNELRVDIKEKAAWRMFKRGVMHRSLMNLASSKMKNYVFQKMFSKVWGEERATPFFPPKSFNQLWKERRK